MFADRRNCYICSMEECPCEKCIHYEVLKRHPNPNAIDDYWCNLRNKAIYLTSHDHVFHPDTWIMPCGGYMFRDRDDVPDMTGVIGYSRRDGLLYETEIDYDNQPEE